MGPCSAPYGIASSQRAYRPGKASPSRSPAAGDRAARVERARGVRGSRMRRGMGGALVSGRRARSSVSFVRPGGSARRRSSESPSSGARLIGGDWAGRRAYHREGAPPAEPCGGTAARLRDWHSACAARCNGAAGHSEGGVGRGRRRAGSEGREGASGPGAPFLGRFSAVHAVHLGHRVKRHTIAKLRRVTRNGYLG